jgi:hypothetical protein
LPLSTGGERPLFGGVPAAGGPTQTGEDLCSLFGVIEDETIDEATMDDLFREILAAPPTPSSDASTLVDDESEVLRLDQSTVDANTDTNLGKDMEIEMQRLFDLVHVAGTTVGSTIDGIPPLPAEESCNTALELDLGAWEASIGLTQPVF